MSIFIIDSPPSCGSTLEVQRHVYQQNSPQVFARTRHLGYGDISDSRSLSLKIMEAVGTFLAHAPQSDGEIAIFDWSPITLRAYGTLNSLKPSQEAIDALREFSERIRKKAVVVLLLPSKGYKAPPIVKGFDGVKLERFGTELKSAYASRGFQIKVSPVSESPYIDKRQGSRRKLTFEEPKTNLSGELPFKPNTHSPNRAAG